MHPAVEYHEIQSPRWRNLYRTRRFKQRAEEILGHVKACAEPGQDWLDAGCGNGVLSQRLLDLGLNVTGVDGSPKMLEMAKRTVRPPRPEIAVSFRQIQTIERTGLPDESFDGILCSSVIEYVDSPRECLAEFHRLLRPGGNLIFTVPNVNCWYRRIEAALFWLTSKTSSAPPRPALLRHSKNHYREAAIRRLVQESDFSVSGLGYCAFYPVYLHFRWTAALLLVAAKKV